MPNDKLKQLEGREVSYKELCQTLGEPVKGGKSKMAQMKEFEKYCRIKMIRFRKSNIQSNILSSFRQTIFRGLSIFFVPIHKNRVQTHPFP